MNGQTSLSSWHMKGKTALRLFSKFSSLRKTRLSGNDSRAKVYRMDNVGVNEDMIGKYPKYQDKNKGEESQLPPGETGLFPVIRLALIAIGKEGDFLSWPGERVRASGMGVDA